VPPVVSANLSQKRSRMRAAERMKRILGRTVVALIAALAVLYVGDSVVWRIRVATGGGMGKVTVSNMTALPLKDNKEEYFWNGNSDVDCSRSIFPQAGAGACWWLQRHNVLYEQ
jgi:hypothetical protein